MTSLILMMAALSKAARHPRPQLPPRGAFREDLRMFDIRGLFVSQADQKFCRAAKKIVIDTNLDDSDEEWDDGNESVHPATGKARYATFLSVLEHLD
jgi:hypothetical protein